MFKDRVLICKADFSDGFMIRITYFLDLFLIRKTDFLIRKTEIQFLQIIKKLPKSLPAGF